MKRSSAQEAAHLRIERHFVQLTQGCGIITCPNTNCASSSNFLHSGLSRNEIAALAVQFARQRVALCDTLTLTTCLRSAANVTNMTTLENSNASSSFSASAVTSSMVGTTDFLSMSLTLPINGDTHCTVSSSSPEHGGKLLKSTTIDDEDVVTDDNILLDTATSSFATHRLMNVDYMTEALLSECLQACEITGSYAPLIRSLGSVFNNPDSLQLSFLMPECYLSGEESLAPCVDLASLQRFMTNLFMLPDNSFQEALCTSVTNLCRTLRMDLMARGTADILVSNGISRFQKADYRDQALLNVFLILFDLPLMTHADYCELVLPVLCKATAALPIDLQARLCRSWLTWKAPILGQEVGACETCEELIDENTQVLRDPTRLLELQRVLMQLVTLRCFVTDWDRERERDKTPNDDDVIPDVCRVLKLVYFTAVLGSEREPLSLRIEQERLNAQFHEQLNQFYSEVDYTPGNKSLIGGITGATSLSISRVSSDALARALNIDPLRCRVPLIPHVEFINETLNEYIVIEKDYHNYKLSTAEGNARFGNAHFSFMEHSFLLSTVTKNTGMYFDNRLRMIQERRGALLHALVHDAPTAMPYLKLRVRRDHIVEDALIGLEIAAMENPADLKKQLYVEFEGEQGIDEGGVSKEFFQLIIEAIFNEDYGMFIQDHETMNFWFHPASLENLREFTLIGCVLGLAIYNHVILNVKFPAVLYRKLFGKLGIFEDLRDLHPSLYRGLTNLLEYEADDVEDTFAYTFSINEMSLWGSVQHKELRAGGVDEVVNSANRHEFVQLYADFVLNRSTSAQFNAFRKGFEMVTDESPLRDLFRPDELEVLVCGCQEYDFVALEAVTEYDGGYTERSPVVINFWNLVHHEMTLEQQKLLLQFTTGTDRVPVGGMPKLRFILAKQGPDSDRLPSSHTCFNVLLLPEYSAKEKLRERLLKAISYSKGFGML